MRWLLPLSLVLLVGIVVGAGHLLFMRWIQRTSAPEPTVDHQPPDPRDDEAR